MASPTTESSIPEMPGFDLSTSLYRVGNNWALLQNILFIFLRSNQSTFQQFMTAATSSDWPTAIRIAHTVKGSSATIGAVDLSQVAGEIEDLLKNGKHQEAAFLHTKFKTVFDDTLSSLEKIKSEQDKPVPTDLPAEPSSKEELLQLIDDITRNLNDDLSKAEIQIKRFSCIQRHLFTDENFCTELISAFEHFHFQKVKSLLKQLRQTLMTHPE